MQPTKNCLNTTHISLLQANFTSIHASVSLIKLLAVHTSHLDRTMAEAIEEGIMKAMEEEIMEAMEEDYGGGYRGRNNENYEGYNGGYRGRNNGGYEASYTSKRVLHS